jgi:hypothetical protein
MQNQGQLQSPHEFNPRMPEYTPNSTRSNRDTTPMSIISSLPPKSSPLKPTEPSTSKPLESTAGRLGKKESTTDLTAVEQLAKTEPAVNGVVKETEGKVQKPERAGSPATSLGGVSKREEKPAATSRLNPNAKPFAPRDEVKVEERKAKPEEKKPKVEERRPRAEERRPRAESKVEETEQEEGEISATPDRRHEPESEEEHRPKVLDAKKESPVWRDAEGEKVPLGRLLAEASNRRVTGLEKGVPEKANPRGTATEPATRRERKADEGGRDVSTAKEAGRESRGREGDVSRAKEAPKEGPKAARESGERRSMHRSESKDGLREGVSEKEGARAREGLSPNVSGLPPMSGLPPRSRPSSSLGGDQTERKAGDLAGAEAVVGRSSREGRAPSKEAEKGVDKEAELRKGPVKEDVEGREYRKTSPAAEPSARKAAEERSERGLEGRVKAEEPAGGRRIKSEARVVSDRNGGRETKDEHVERADRKAEVIEKKGSGVPTDRKVLEDRKGSGELEERKATRVITLGRSKPVKEEGELPEKPDVFRRLSSSPSERRAEEAGRRDRGKRPAKEDGEPERDRKRHKFDSDAHPPDQRQVVRSLVDQNRRIVTEDDRHRRVVLDEDDHPRRVLPEEPRRGMFDDRGRGIVEEARRGGYEERPRFFPDGEGRAGPIREVVESARAPSRERERDFRGLRGLDGVSEEGRHRRKEPPAELRRRGGEAAGERFGRDLSPVPERNVVSGRLERVAGEEEVTRLREQLLKQKVSLSLVVNE